MEVCKYWCKYWCKNKYEAMEICKYGDLYPLKMKNQGVKKKFQQLQQQVWWDVNDICVWP